MKKKKSCPCGSDKTFEECCNRYISGKRLATTPEALMRSRYSAYTKANIAYIQKTMHGPASQGYNPEDAREWAEKADWLGLEVIKSFKKSDKIGYVKFIVRYRIDQIEHQMYECSEFHYINNHWYYVNGKTLTH